MNVNNANLVSTIAVTDLNRAKQFYGGILGLREVGSVMPDHADLIFSTGGGQHICLYERAVPSGSTATVCSFEVDDVAKVVKGLQDKGVAFEDYDLPDMGIKTEKGIATAGDLQSAWFKDPDGNILSVGNGLAVLKGDVKGRSVARHA